MSGLMRPGPTLYEAEQQRKKKGSRGLLGEPLSYAPGPLGLLGNALLSAQYATGEKPMDEGLSALAMLTGLMQGTKVAPIMPKHYTFDSSSDPLWKKATNSREGAIQVRKELLEKGFKTLTTPGGELVALDVSAIKGGF